MVIVRSSVSRSGAELFSDRKQRPACSSSWAGVDKFCPPRFCERDTNPGFTSAFDIGPLAVSKSDGASFGTDLANQYGRGISRWVKLKS